MGYYMAKCKNVERNSSPKRTSAGRGSNGVSASVYLDTNAQDVVGVELWLRNFLDRGPRLRVSTIGNGCNVNRSGYTLFDGTIEEFVKLLGGRTAC